MLQTHIQDVYVPIIPLLQQEIYELVAKVGVVEDRQIRKLFQIEEKQENHFMFCLENLFSTRESGLNGDKLFIRDHLVSLAEREKERIDASPVDCLWDICHHIDQVDLSLLETAEKPANLLYALDVMSDEGDEFSGKETIVSTYISRDDIWKVGKMQEKYSQRILCDEETDEKLCNFSLNFVTTDSDILDKIIENSEPDDNGNIVSPILVPTILTLVDHSKMDDDEKPLVHHWDGKGNANRLLTEGDFRKIREACYYHDEA